MEVKFNNPVTLNEDIILKDLDGSKEPYIDAATLLIDEGSGITPATATVVGSNLIEFPVSVGAQSPIVIPTSFKGYAPPNRKSVKDTQTKNWVTYDTANKTVSAFYVVYWNNVVATNSKGSQGISLLSPITTCVPDNSGGGGNGGGGGGNASNPKIELIKFVKDVNDTNKNNLVDAGDIITYGFVVVNSGDVELKNIELNDSIVNISGGVLASLAVAAEDNSTFSATYTITKADVLRGGVENRASVTAKDPSGNDVTDTSDTATDPDGNIVNDPLATETPSPLGINSNDANDPTDDPTTLKTTPMGLLIGVVYEDTNGNGKQDDDENGIEGVNVEVTDSKGNKYTLTTDKDGNYAQKVPAGSTKTEIDETTLPDNFTQTEGSNPTSNIDVPVDGIGQDVDGYEPPANAAKVKGVVYEDTNGNGKQDSDEPGIEGVVVEITDTTGKTYTLTTNKEGKYSQTVTAGDTVIDIDETTLPDNFTQTEGSDSTTVNVPAGGEAEDIDGYQPPSSAGKVKGVIYEDKNGNGAQDSDEPGIEGVKVKITDSAGKNYVVTTDKDGKYEKTVPSGDTKLDIDETTLPKDYTQSEGIDPTTVKVPAGGEASDVDGYKPPADISTIVGVIYEDLNANGKQDPGESGISGVEVVIVDSEGKKYTLTSDNDGKYSQNVPAGVTGLEINEATLPKNYVQTEGSNPSSKKVPLGGSAKDIDGYVPGGMVAGVVYEDTNGNGMQEANEDGIEGVKVKVKDSQGKEYILTTDKDGHYTQPVPAGSTEITIDETTLPSGLTQSEGSRVTTLTVPPKGIAADTDGYKPPKDKAIVKGVVYEDTNNNGKQDATEPGISGVVVTVTDSAGNDHNVTTNSEGKYSQVVPDGNTTIKIDETTFPNGFTQSEGSNPTTVNVPKGGEAKDIDGFTPPSNAAKVKGVVYEDTNNNGSQDANEKGIEGVEVKITDKDGKEYIVTTNKDGKYEQIVPAGSTKIEIVETTLPSGYTQSEGSNPTTVNVPQGGEASDVDGFTPPSDASKVKGVVYEDTNGNGTQDANESGIKGVTVYVIDKEGKKYTLTTDNNGTYEQIVPAGEVNTIIDTNTLPKGFSQSEGSNPTSLVAPKGGEVSDKDGFKPGGVVAGVVYEDTNGNGKQDSTEPGIAGVKVKVTDKDGVEYELTTDSNGAYSQTVPAGTAMTKIVESTVPATFTRTEGQTTNTLTVPVNGIAVDIDGYKPPANSAKVKGVVYEDSNGNGKQDANEPGISGVVVTITDSAGNDHNVTTDKDGKYSQVVPEGNTTIDIDETTLPSGFTQSEGKDPTTVNVPKGVEVEDIDGFTPPSNASKIKGVVYNDANGNGTQDSTEDGIEGVVVKITDSSGKTYSVVTNKEGKYEQIVEPGNAIVDIDDNTLPSGAKQSEGSDSTIVNVPAGGVGQDIDGYVVEDLSKVKGVVYEDTNGNGTQDNNENGISGVEVVVVDKDGKKYTLTTDKDGKYEQVVVAGAVAVVINKDKLPQGYEQSEGSNPTALVAPKGGEVSDIDGFKPGGTVAGVVYEDNNANGKQDPGELGIVGVKVKITDNNGDEYIVTTDGNGAYSQVVPVGNATTEIDESTLPNGYTQTQGNKVSTLTVEINKIAQDVDGYKPPKTDEVKVKGVVYEDTNGNGKQDKGEGGIPGVTVKITDSKGVEHTLTTNNEGVYEQNVPKGKTKVEIDESTLPSGYTQTEGSNPTNLDVKDVIAKDIDGFKPPKTMGKVEGVIYEDTNGNGKQDSSEPGIEGVEVAVIDKDGNKYLLKTDKEGKYQKSVVAGSTIIDINDNTLPQGYKQTQGNDSTIVEVPAGGIASDIDGFEPPSNYGVVEGVVYIDRNGNGKQDADEKGEPNVEVTIIDSKGKRYTVMTDSNGKYKKAVPAGEVMTVIDQNAFDTTFEQTQGQKVTKLTVEPRRVAKDVDGYKPPIDAIDDGVFTLKDYNTYCIDLLKNDTFSGDVDINILTQPKYGDVKVVTKNGKKCIEYTPKGDYNNVNDNFKYSITDKNGHTDNAEIKLKINCSSTQRHDSGDAFSLMGVLGLIIFMLVSVLKINRKQELGV